MDDFPALRLAREAGNRCGTLPAVMNAANEVAVDAFLKGGIAFPRIWGLVEEVMNGHEVIDSPNLDDLLVSDREARAAAEQFMRGIERKSGGEGKSVDLGGRRIMKKKRTS